MDSEYAEAVELLAMAADELSPDANARHEAGSQLLQDLKNVAEQSKRFELIHDLATHVFLRLPEYGEVQIVCRNYGRIFVVAQDMRPEIEVPLWYDASCKKLKSPDRDEVLTPIPGEVRPHRTAVAAVVRVAIDMLRAPANDG